MLNKMPVSTMAELSKLSKSYISQVKNGKRPPSDKLLQALEHSELNERARNARRAIESLFEIPTRGNVTRDFEFL